MRSYKAPSRKNLSNDAWRNAVSAEIARLTNRSFGWQSERRMFKLTNSPAWITFLNAEIDKGTAPKIAAQLFLVAFPEVN